MWHSHDNYGLCVCDKSRSDSALVARECSQTWKRERFLSRGARDPKISRGVSVFVMHVPQTQTGRGPEPANIRPIYGLEAVLCARTYYVPYRTVPYYVPYSIAVRLMMPVSHIPFPVIATVVL